MTEVIRYSLIGKEDVKLEPRDGRFETTLADGRVVLLSALDVALLLSDRYPTGTLPDAPVGQLAWVTDRVRGLWAVNQTGTWFSLAGGRADVKEFGARGDGITDDRAAIQAAIDAVHADGGGTVYVPPGTYRISGSPGVQLAENIELVGAGMSASRFFYVGSGSCVYAISVEDVAVRHLRIEGDGVGGPASEGVEFRSVTRGIITDCHVTTFQQHGLVFNACAQVLMAHNVVENIDADRNDTGVGIMGTFEGTNRVMIVSNHIRDVNNAGIYLDAGTTGGTGVPSENVVVANNVIENTGRIAGIAGAGSKRMVIANNVIMNAGARVNTAASGIAFIQDNATPAEIMQQLVITGNYIGFPTEHGIRLDGIRDFVLANNVIVNPGALSPAPAGDVRGILLIASGGTGTPTTQKGVVSGNVIEYTGVGGKLTYGIEIAATCDTLMLANNLISGQSGAAVRDVSASDQTYVGPTFDVTNSALLPSRFRGRQATGIASHTGDTTETQLGVSHTIPARTLGGRGRVRVRYAGRVLAGGSPNTATVRLYFGATVETLLAATASATTSFVGECMIENRDASSQLIATSTTYGTVVNRTSSVTASESTTVDVAVRVTGQLVNGGDTVAVDILQVDVER